MSNVRELHNKAMELAQSALLSRHKGHISQAENYAKQACELEMQAAELIPLEKKSEPTRSILYRSAASLAIQSKQLILAQRLIAKGLSGYPAPEIEQELKDLFEQINFETHLKTRGVILADEDLQLSLNGPAVGSGTILYDEFIKRIKSARSIIDRTILRLMGKEYQRSGRLSQKSRPYFPAISTPRIGSFSISIKLALPEGQQQLPFINASNIIEEILTGIELVNNSEEDKLKKRIQQEGYYKNFVSLTRDISPDGEKIKLIGFTSSKRQVKLTRIRENISLFKKIEPTEDKELTPIEIIGILDEATCRKDELIGITSIDNKEYSIVVQEGLDDLVHSYFREKVVVSGTYDGKKVYLEDIKLNEE